MGPNAESSRRWLEHGASLIVSAKFLFESLVADRLQDNERQRVLELGKLRGAMTLLGAGLECVLKARAVYDGTISTDIRTGASKLDRLWSSHNLRDMAASLSLAFTEDELLLLERASHGVRWLGRYPDPKTSAELEKAVSIDAQKLKSADFEAALHVHYVVQQSLPF